MNIRNLFLVLGSYGLFCDESGILLCGSMFGLKTDAYELRRATGCLRRRSRCGSQPVYIATEP